MVASEVAQTCAGGSSVDVATARCDVVRLAHQRSRRVDAAADDRLALGRLDRELPAALCVDMLNPRRVAVERHGGLLGRLGCADLRANVEVDEGDRSRGDEDWLAEMLGEIIEGDAERSEYHRCIGKPLIKPSGDTGGLDGFDDGVVSDSESDDVPEEDDEAAAGDVSADGDAAERPHVAVVAAVTRRLGLIERGQRVLSAASGDCVGTLSLRLWAEPWLHVRCNRHSLRVAADGRNPEIKCGYWVKMSTDFTQKYARAFEWLAMDTSHATHMNATAKARRGDV